MFWESGFCLRCSADLCRSVRLPPRGTRLKCSGGTDGGDARPSRVRTRSVERQSREAMEPGRVHHTVLGRRLCEGGGTHRPGTPANGTAETAEQGMGTAEAAPELRPKQLPGYRQRGGDGHATKRRPDTRVTCQESIWPPGRPGMGAGRAASRECRHLSRGSGSARFLVSRGGRRARGSGGAREFCGARVPPPRAQRPRRAAMPAQNTASSGGKAGAAGGAGSDGRAPRGDRVLVAGPLGAEMGEQAEAAVAVITPAMLKEEQQLEAAGLEKERQMLEKVRGGPGAAGPPRQLGLLRRGGSSPAGRGVSAVGPPGRGCAGSGVALAFQNKQTCCSPGP